MHLKLNAVYKYFNYKMINRVSLIINKFKSSDSRSKLAYKNIAGSFICKFISVMVNLALIPISIDYLNSNQYGIWLAISSIMMWLSYFDIGLTQGFRNRFAQAKAHGDIRTCKTLVSTTYLLMIIIFGGLCTLLFVIIPLIDWRCALDVEISNDILIKLILILTFFFCMKFILSVLTSLCAADQRNSYSATIDAIGQFLILVTVFFLSKSSGEDNLLIFATIMAGLPCIVLIASTIYLFNVRYAEYVPSLKYIKLSITRNIVGLGSKIFIIQITNVLLFQIANILILKYCGGEEVTKYNIVNKYFGVLSMIFGIIITPFWTAFTDAQAKEDFAWIKQTFKRINRIYFYFCGLALILLVISPYVYNIWVSKAGGIPFLTSALMCLYILLLIRSLQFSNILNGLDLVNIQMWCNIALCIVIVPTLILSAKYFGVYGILLNLIIACFVQSIICRYGLFKYLNRN